MNKAMVVPAALLFVCYGIGATRGRSGDSKQISYAPGHSKNGKAQANTKLVDVGDLAQRAVEQAQLTLSDGKPFHLYAKVVETTNPNSSYRAEIQEDWISPDKWRREVQSPGFSQTIVTNGSAIFEDDKGDYYPWWLKSFVVALFDPLPMLDQLKQLNRSIPQPKGEQSASCLDLHSRIDRSIFCFEGDHGLVQSVFVTGYAMEFKNYQPFAGKRVARQIEMDPENGTHLELRIKELGELSDLDESRFVVAKPTPPTARIQSAYVNEDELRQIALGSTDFTWPTEPGGQLAGRCAVYVSVDRAGVPREVWPWGCDNSGLEDPMRDQVSKWRFKPATLHGSPVQLECLVTTTFDLKATAAP